MKKFITLLFCTVMAACGGDGDSEFEGTYQVSSHTLNDAACDAEGPEVTDGYAYFKLEMGEILGFPILELFSCTSDTECSDVNEFFFSKMKGDWIMQVRSSYELNDECHLQETTGSLEGTDAGILIEVKSSSAVITPSGSEVCDPDLVEKYQEQMLCEEYEVIEGNIL
jgi:hypothetical protein